jgi:small subunit ribosomal protein S17e
VGRIKTRPLKRVTREIMEAHGERFTNDFDNNKKLVSEVADVSSKKLRNIIAGYATRLKKADKY